MSFDWLQRHWLAVILLLAYSAILVHHAIEGHRATRSTSHYYVGGRAMSGTAIGLSFFATYVSTNSFIGIAGQSYTFGPVWLLFGLFFVVFCLIAWLVIAPRLRAFTASLDSVTIADYVGFRFSSPTARLLGGLVIVVASLFYMTAIYKGVGNALSVLLELSHPAAIALVLATTMLYTAAGGFLSVVRTDMIQGCIILAAAAILFAGITREAGGLGSITRLRDDPASAGLFTFSPGLSFGLLLGIFISGAMKQLVEPRQLSRFYALVDAQSVERGMWISVVAFAFAFTLLLPLGLYGRVILGPGIEDTDLVIPTLLAGDVFPELIRAFLLVAMTAAAMSSLDSVLLVTAATFQRDVAGLLLPRFTDARALRATRIWVLVFSGITALIALDPPGGIVRLTVISGNLYAAAFFPAILLGLHWRRGSGAAVLGSYAAGIGTLLVWPSTPWSGWIHEVFPALAASLTAYVAIAAMTAPTAPATLTRYWK